MVLRWKRSEKRGRRERLLAAGPCVTMRVFLEKQAVRLRDGETGHMRYGPCCLSTLARQLQEPSCRQGTNESHFLKSLAGTKPEGPLSQGTRPTKSSHISTPARASGPVQQKARQWSGRVQGSRQGRAASHVQHLIQPLNVRDWHHVPKTSHACSAGSLHQAQHGPQRTGMLPFCGVPRSPKE